ncbi:MAG: hypothetical protein SF162_17115 [bacterium]|nr:hypothetical protein [bacterium]
MPLFNQTHICDLTPAITAGAYSAGDVVGGLLVFALHSAGGGGVVRRLVIIDGDNERAAGRLFLFNGPPAAVVDNAPFAPTRADLNKLVGVIAVSAADYTTVNSRAFALIRDLSIEFTAPDGRLYGYFVCDATPVYTTTGDLTLRLTAWED